MTMLPSHMIGPDSRVPSAASAVSGSSGGGNSSSSNGPQSFESLFIDDEDGSEEFDDGMSPM